MNTTAIALSPDPRLVSAFAHDSANAKPLAPNCACDGMAAAFESVQGPRLKRAASDDGIIECIDARDPEQEPATMVQRTAVKNDRGSA